MLRIMVPGLEIPRGEGTSGVPDLPASNAIDGVSLPSILTTHVPKSISFTATDVRAGAVAKCAPIRVVA